MILLQCKFVNSGFCRFHMQGCQGCLLPLSLSSSLAGVFGRPVLCWIYHSCTIADVFLVHWSTDLWLSQGNGTDRIWFRIMKKLTGFTGMDDYNFTQENYRHQVTKLFWLVFDFALFVCFVGWLIVHWYIDCSKHQKPLPPSTAGHRAARWVARLIGPLTIRSEPLKTLANEPKPEVSKGCFLEVFGGFGGFWGSFATPGTCCLAV